MKKDFVVSTAVVKKINKLLDFGLTAGMGEPKPGRMCVEAAVCYALDLEHGDDPPCVGKVVREFKVSLNDCRWKSNKARAAGMRKLAIAQLGSNTINQWEFAEHVVIQMTKRVLPLMLHKKSKEGIDFNSIATFVQAKKAARHYYNHAYGYFYGYHNEFARRILFACKALQESKSRNSACSAVVTMMSGLSYLEEYTGTLEKLLLVTAEIGLEGLRKSPGYKFI